MTKRDNHYEVAFEHWLQARQIPYVAVDEVKRARLGDDSLKSLDFIVSPANASQRWLVDVKGRKFPSGARRQYWRNWVTEDDLRSLSRWNDLFGQQFAPLLVFAYLVIDEVSPLPAEQLFRHRQRLYGFVAIRHDHYSGWSRVISPKWSTVSIPAARFRELARPAEIFFGSDSTSLHHASSREESISAES